MQTIPDEVFHTRILFDSKLRRAAYKRFVALVSTSASPQPVRQEALEAFLLELDTLHNFMNRQLMIHETADREAQHFDAERARIEEQIAEARSDIERLKAELAQAQIRKQQKIEYDAVAREILKLPSRDESERAIAETLAEITQVDKERESILESKAMRIKQLTSVVASIHELQSSAKAADVGGEDESEERIERERRPAVDTSDAGGIAENADAADAGETGDGDRTADMTAADATAAEADNRDTAPMEE
ncbi:hypothetical protein HK105_204047 [Polyrhizophydium stewartii]|uniref:THO complex subunit 7 n=1 Tax=Polyrhizophydium stewartii TaxID=2732419 RepID=A0ABR4NA09_9FUNG